MTAGTLLELIYLEFACSVGKEQLFDILKATALVMHPGDTRRHLQWRRRTGDASTGEAWPPKRAEAWEAGGGRIYLRSSASVNDRASTSGTLVGILEFDRGFHLEATVNEGSSEGSRTTVCLQRLWPHHFDHIRDLFRDSLGAACDATDAPAVALRNARAALQASQGAFARHLIDQAMEWRRARPGEAGEEKNWVLLQELSRELRRSGPEKPDD